jgi:hypothetical protein
MWTFRSILATVLWVAALLIAAFLLFSGWLLFAPFAFATGGGGEILLAVLAVVVLGISAHLLGRRTHP